MNLKQNMLHSPSRNLYAEQALSYIPHLVQLVDRNPYSPTYGCFDREYWHYRTLDFPCGMSQEFVLPFALLYKNTYPGNKYHGWERMREIAEAGMRFAMKSSHADGTCDDYFPWEQAMGALVFSTYACTEAYQLLGMKDDRLINFFLRRGDHLAEVNETGCLSNHQAFAALAAYNIYLVTGDEKYRQVAEDRVDLTLSWQHPEEGWFQEYEGADPGYHTCTIAFLAKLYQKSGNEELLAPLLKAVDFAWNFMHPDGSYGGEYGSRNTFHFYAHGFEVLAPFSEKAGQIADQFLRSIGTDKRYHNDDDRMCCHNVYDWLQAWDDYHLERPEPINTRENFTKWMPDAGMAVVKNDAYYAVANLNKGGVIKAFTEAGCFASDTGIVAELANGKVVVSHLMDELHETTATPETGEFECKGLFSRRQKKLSSPVRLIVFRILNLTISRFWPNLVRSLIQRLLITGKNRTDYRFERTIEFRSDSIKITDAFPNPIPVKRLSAGSDATSIYVANSNVFQESVVRVPWAHATEDIVTLTREGEAIWERNVSPSD